MESSNEHIGRRLGNYRVVDEIMSGSFGSVYLAQHKFLHRIVAVKFLRSDRIHSQREWDQFFAEAEFLEQLQHPHILPIIDLGIDDMYPYIITEYAHGGSLREMLLRHRPNKIPAREALRILTQIGNGLHHAHQQGIVHRDLKPENILFNKHNDALLADFGIAILLSSAASQRRTSIAGTRTYMAPEQFLGTPGPYSDQYALGCIAYELFTGRPPFAPNHAISLRDRHLYHAPIPPTRRNPQIPSYIEQAILTALEKQPYDRHADIATFISALNAYPVFQQQQVRSPRARVPQV